MSDRPTSAVPPSAACAPASRRSCERRPASTHFAEADEVAALLGADDLRRVGGSTPRGVLDAGGDVVVQVGAAGP